ncbi:MAG: hypothetical protein JHC39_06405 [Lentimicrobium sp.]|jgi:hypothetical protein|nr:hypothetical protein [Lentimicrobium sp.]
MQKRNNKSANIYAINKIKNYFWIILAISLFGYLISKIIRNSFTDSIIGNNPQTTKAIIINDKNYEPNSPVGLEFTYSYEFIVDGKSYRGNSHDQTLKIGDTVEVQYNKEYPSINKPLNPKE